MESTQLQKRLYKLLRLKNLYLSHCGRASNHLGAWVAPSLRFVPPTLADQVCATTVMYGLLIFFCEVFPSSSHHSHRSKSLLGVQQDITAVCNSIQRWMACASFFQSYEEQIFSYFRITNSKFPLCCLHTALGNEYKSAHIHKCSWNYPKVCIYSYGKRGWF